SGDKRAVALRSDLGEHPLGGGAGIGGEAEPVGVGAGERPRGHAGPELTVEVRRVRGVVRAWLEVVAGSRSGPGDVEAHRGRDRVLAQELEAVDDRDVLQVK